MADSSDRGIGKADQEYRRQVAARKSQRETSFDTISGEPLDILYTPLHLEGFDYLRKLGFPGEYPYTRGVRDNMYRGRLWTMRQFAGFGTAADTNRRFKYLLEHGQTGLSTAFDLSLIHI